MVFINTTNAPALGSFIFRILPNFVPCPSEEAKARQITDKLRAAPPLIPVFFSLPLSRRSLGEGESAFPAFALIVALTI